MTDRRALLRRVALAALAAALPCRVRGGEAPLVAAAADLQFALPEIAAAFEAATGDSVRLTFGSSGNLARQIRQGAPFELYLSADEGYVLDLARDGYTRDEGTVYAVGRLALVVPHGSPLAPDGSLDDLARALAAGRVTRFAITNPAHAPYGRRAEEALRHKGLWQAIGPRLVLGENVSQAAQFAVSGNAEGGLIAYSLALAPEIAARTRFALVPAEWHSPLRQRMVLTRGAGPVAEAFYAFLQGAEARAIFDDYGLALPRGEG
jgi:molybdate transport system substrate-binding protein